jgi:secreted trypsin-like serine protease
MKFSLLILILTNLISFSYEIKSGKSINIEDAPYMVFIQEVINLSRANVEKCGGAIIRERIDSFGKKFAKFVVTAARCVVDSPSLVPLSPKDFYLLFGSSVRGGIDAAPGEFIDGIQKVYIHPAYRGYGSPHDIALLEIKDEIQLDGVRKGAIKLSGTIEEIAQGMKCYVNGWGENDKNDTKQLQQASLNIQSYEFCYDKYKNFTTKELLMKHQICALGSSPTDYSNICRGDYGSPLVRKSDETLLGITSFGRSCNNNNTLTFPSIYTKISDNLDFIDYVTKNYQ